MFPARPVGFEPTTLGFEGSDNLLAANGTELQQLETVRVRTSGRIHRSQRKATIRSQLVTSLLQAAAEKSRRLTVRRNKEPANQGSNEGAHLLTVKEVAATLRVCTATIYAMIERGELEHVRVSNAIRVVIRFADSG